MTDSDSFGRSTPIGGGTVFAHRSHSNSSQVVSMCSPMSGIGREVRDIERSLL